MERYKQSEVREGSIAERLVSWSQGAKMGKISDDSGTAQICER